MSLECSLEIVANSAEGIAALSKIQRSDISPPTGATVSDIDYQLESGVHETLASLVFSLKWSDLSYGVAGSLIASAIFSFIAVTLKRSFSKHVTIQSTQDSGPTVARIELADKGSVLRIEMIGAEADATAQVIRELMERTHR